MRRGSGSCARSRAGGRRGTSAPSSSQSFASTAETSWSPAWTKTLCDEVETFTAQGVPGETADDTDDGNEGHSRQTVEHQGKLARTLPMHQAQGRGAVLTYGGLGREQRRADGATHDRGPGSSGLQAGRNEQGGRSPHPGAGQGASRGPREHGAADRAISPPWSLFPRCGSRLYGRQGAELLRLGQAELLHSAFRVGRARPGRRAVPLELCRAPRRLLARGRGRGPGLSAGAGGAAGGRRGRRGPRAGRALPRGLAAAASRPVPSPRPAARRAAASCPAAAWSTTGPAHGFVCDRRAGRLPGPILAWRRVRSPGADLRASLRRSSPRGAAPATSGAGPGVPSSPGLVAPAPRARPPLAPRGPRGEHGRSRVDAAGDHLHPATLLVGAGLPDPPALGRPRSGPGPCTPRPSSGSWGRGPGASATCSRRVVPPTGATARTRTVSTSTSSSR